MLGHKGQDIQAEKMLFPPTDNPWGSLSPQQQLHGWLTNRSQSLAATRPRFHLSKPCQVPFFFFFTASFNWNQEVDLQYCRTACSTACCSTITTLLRLLFQQQSSNIHGGLWFMVLFDSAGVQYRSQTSESLWPHQIPLSSITSVKTTPMKD